VLVPEMWASLAIVVMWLAALVDAIVKPDAAEPFLADGPRWRSSP
jgi:hypothetical protein